MYESAGRCSPAAATPLVRKEYMRHIVKAVARVGCGSWEIKRHELRSFHLAHHPTRRTKLSVSCCCARA